MNSDAIMVTLPLRPDDDDSIVEFDDGIRELTKEINSLTDDDLVTSERRVSFGGPKKSNRASVRMSAFPDDIKNTAMKMDLDRNNDGELSIGDFVAAFDDLEQKRRSNKTLTRTIFGMVIAMILLIVCIFAASLTAARLSKNFVVNPITGLAMVSGSESPAVMKTTQALYSIDNVTIGELSTSELGNLEQLVLNSGDLKFIVKGYSRDPFGDKTIILVEGGSIVYDPSGIIEAFGNAKIALQATFGMDAFEDEGSGRFLGSWMKKENQFASLGGAGKNVWGKKFK